ncbi:lysozyme inhibitor LprI family protein [Roseomonas sp. 18066]|uniref:lysozyme inhibitor LprI family protein n=1 Tax=Roseomonas sp. 18066 TaxID=2681412 RepID=UPI001358CE1D|nr:lysozyme inhibitor LprI family protein [Roseomonas sp. 18066]
MIRFAIRAIPLLIAAALPAAAATPPAPDVALSRCLRAAQGGLESAQCYGEAEEQAMAQQARLLGALRARLARPGPLGTDYPAAAKLLEDGQSAWESYVAADCRLLETVFGDGNAQSLASADCAVKHLVARNRGLEQLKKDFLD